MYTGAFNELSKGDGHTPSRSRAIRLGSAPKLAKWHCNFTYELLLHELGDAGPDAFALAGAELEVAAGALGIPILVERDLDRVELDALVAGQSGARPGVGEIDALDGDLLQTVMRHRLVELFDTGGERAGQDQQRGQK